MCTGSSFKKFVKENLEGGELEGFGCNGSGFWWSGKFGGEGDFDRGVVGDFGKVKVLGIGDVGGCCVERREGPGGDTHEDPINGGALVTVWGVVGGEGL